MRIAIEVKLHRHQTKRPERYETVRAFGLSVFVASLSSVSRYLVVTRLFDAVTPLSIGSMPGEPLG
jgi:hypothetical protein